VGAMYGRLSDLSRRLEWLGLTHRSHEAPMLERMAGTDDIGALLTLANVVEPVKDYARMGAVTGNWDFRAPLNHLVDAVNPESETGRKFRDLVQQYINSRYQDHEAEQSIRAILTSWRDNDTKLERILGRSFLLSEVAPLSQELSMVGTTGLSALDYLDRSQASPQDWRMQRILELDAAKAPKAMLLLTVTEPVRQLVELSAAGQPQ
jgi:hexosaminidase